MAAAEIDLNSDLSGFIHKSEKRADGMRAKDHLFNRCFTSKKIWF